MNNIFCYETDIGKIAIVGNDTAITHLCFGQMIPKDANMIETPLLKKANQQEKLLEIEKQNYCIRNMF